MERQPLFRVVSKSFDGNKDIIWWCVMARKISYFNYAECISDYSELEDDDVVLAEDWVDFCFGYAPHFSNRLTG